MNSIPGALEQAGFSVREACVGEAEKHLEQDYFKNTKLVDLTPGQQTTANVHPASGTIAPGLERAVNPLGSQ